MTAGQATTERNTSPARSVSLRPRGASMGILWIIIIVILVLIVLGYFGRGRFGR
jgi:flagellar basal body-associated protein FliL